MKGLLFPKPSDRQPLHKPISVPTLDTLFREEVWELAQGKDRITGQTLLRVSDDEDQAGEVAHLRGRRVKPEWKRDPHRAILLSRRHHRLSHRAIGERIQIVGDDAREPITFRRLDRTGMLLWMRTTCPLP